MQTVTNSMSEPCERCFQPVDSPEEHGVGLCPYEFRPAGYGIIGDDFPGGYIVRHLSPTPQKFYSRTELKRALNEKGLVISGDTPGKPYKIKWSGKVQEQEKAKPIFKTRKKE